MLSRVLTLHLIFLRPDMERSHRVSMKCSSFSPDGKNFCQFMTPNFPKPMFLTQISPGLAGISFSIPTWHLALGQWPRAWSRLGIEFGAIWVSFGDPFLFGAHVGPIWGPIWRQKADITEADGRLNGGLGAEPPEIWTATGI